MEILLIACMLAYVAGAQSEQSKLGVSPAQRAQMREETRHRKAIQKIADKHGGAHVPSSGETPPDGVKTPGTFRAGYRSSRPARPPFGQRVGERAGRGVTWAQDTGRDAWRTYRERRKREGHDGPELVMVPYPPAYPPAVPPVPAVAPPPVGGMPEKPNAPPPAPATDDAKKTDEPAATKPDEKAPEAVPPEAAPAAPDSDNKPDAAPPQPKTTPKPEPAKADLEKKPEPAVAPEPESAATAPDPQPANTPEGVGRMATEVSYGSVHDESDELSAMCEDDLRTYDRIKARAEREIGRGDQLMAAMNDTGFGPKVIAWVARCTEIYRVILGGVSDLQENTLGQREAVVKAKTLLEVGQGVYAGIAADMESVADREAYTSDAVDAEDTEAHTETYETKVAA